MEDPLTILKKLRDERVTIMNNNLEIYEDCWHKTTSHQFCLSTDDPVFNGWKGWAVKIIFKSYDLKPSMVVFEYWKIS